MSIKRMNLFVLILIGAMALSGCQHVQQVKNDSMMVQEEEGSGATMGVMTGVTKKDGKMMIMWESGESTVMVEEVTIEQIGTTIGVDGTVRLKSSEVVMMEDGDAVMADGTIRIKNMPKRSEIIINSMDDPINISQIKYQGQVLAGVEAKLLDFNQSDYEAALVVDKNIVLYFYANWCPLCKEEFPKMKAAFNALTDPSVVGFRVNFNDNQTDDDEEALARKFGVIYQHTKVFVKGGKQVLKAPDTWDQDRYASEIESQF